MGPLLRYHTFFQNNDAIRIVDGAQTVRDGDYRAPFHQAFQRFHHHALGFRVESGSGLIQNEDGIIANDCARDSDALPLAAGKCVAALTHQRVVPMRHARDELIHVRELCRIHDLFLGRARVAIGNVVAHGSLKENGFLQHVADMVPKALKFVIPDIDAIDLNYAAGRVVKAWDQTYYGGLTAAGRSDHSHHLAGLDVKTDIFQHRSRRVVRKSYVIEDDVAAEPFRFLRVRALGSNRVSIQNRLDARSTPTAVCAMELVMVARSCTGLKNFVR